MRKPKNYAKELANAPQAVRWFRDNLRAYIEHFRPQGVSQASIAEQAECHKVHVSNVLAGKYSPTLAFCQKIADALKVPCEDLIGNPKKFRVYLD